MRFSKWRTVLVGVSMFMVMTFVTVSTAVATEVGYWNFNESSGTVATDSHGHNGTLTNMSSPGCWVAGKLNNALWFNADGNYNDYVSISGSTDFKSATGSIEFWMKTDYAADPMDMIYIYNGSTDNLAIVRGNGGNIVVQLKNNGTFQVGYYSGKSIADTNWHHIVVTQDGTGPKIYIDGVFCPGMGLGFNYTSWTNNWSSVSGLRIGYAAYYGCWGLLDEVKIYNTALSAVDVRDNYLKATRTGYWKLDEASGYSAADSSNFGNNGTLTSLTSPGCWVFGRSGNALQFSSGGYVACSNNTSLNSAAGSIAFWMKVGNLDSTMDPLYIASSDDNQYLLVEKNNNNNIQLKIQNGGTNLLTVTSTETIPDTNWHHIAITQDGTAGANIYIDGNPCLNPTISGNSVLSWTSFISTIDHFWIGKSGNNTYCGILDDIQIYNKALNSDEVWNIYLATTLNGYWKFDDASGSSATDSSNSGNTGTLTGAGASWVDGRLGKALQFSSGGYVSCSDNLPALKMDKGTISFWMKPDSTGIGSGTTMDPFYIAKDTSNLLLVRKTSDDKIQLIIKASGTNQVSTTSTNAVDANWHYIAITQDGTYAKTYIDGIENASTTSSYWTSFMSTINQCYIGKAAWASVFSGILDDVKVYNSALKASEILQQYYDQGGSSGFGCESNPTGNPIGGGTGYSDIKSTGNYIVANAIQLVSALGSASSGNVIYVNTDINLTGYEGQLVIPAGVTLASNRGYNGSTGYKLSSSTTYAGTVIPLFTTSGDGARITGLRLGGPTSGTTGNGSCGISSAYTVEVDNCEISNWCTGVNPTTKVNGNSQIHHNYIHNCQISGLGYGIYVDSTSAVIKANKFALCRHSISGPGKPGTSFEACYNQIDSCSTDKLHNFDMHGETDYRKADIIAIWRLDEDFGTTAYESAIERAYHIDGTLHSLDSDCWKAGKLKNGLEFNGSGYVSCDDATERSYLVSGQGCIEFWIKPSNNTAGSIMDFRQDATNYLTISRTANQTIKVAVRAGGAEQTLTSTATTSANTWSHVVITKLSGSAALSIYINGGTPATTTTALWKNFTMNYFYIGNDASAAPTPFNGMLDEVRIYKYGTSLSSSDVALHNNNGHADNAADYIDIHHNTFKLTNNDVAECTIRIRGIPLKPTTGTAPYHYDDGTHETTGGVYIHNNWFYQNTGSVAIIQTYAQGYMYSFNNIFTTNRNLEK